MIERDDLQASVAKWTNEDPDFPLLVKAFEQNERLLDEMVRCRVSQHLTQRKVAERMGTSQPVIARVERGDVDPRLSTIQRLAVALGSIVEWRIVSAHTHADGISVALPEKYSLSSAFTLDLTPFPSPAGYTVHRTALVSQDVAPWRQQSATPWGGQEVINSYVSALTLPDGSPYPQDPEVGQDMSLGLAMTLNAGKQQQDGNAQSQAA